VQYVVLLAAPYVTNTKLCFPPAGETGINHSPLDTALLWMHGKIASNKVVVFSKSYCYYSQKAKTALLTLLQPEQMLVIEVDQLRQRPQDDGGNIEADTLMVSRKCNVLNCLRRAFNKLMVAMDLLLLALGGMERKLLLLVEKRPRRGW
jgi:hypothetical protein